MPDQNVAFTYTLNDQSLAVGEWYALRRSEGLDKALSTAWPCTVEEPMSKELSHQPEIVDDLEGGAFALLYRFEDAVVVARLGHGHVHLRAAGKTLEACADAIEGIEQVLPKHEVTDNGKIPVSFWAYTPHGPMSQVRDLVVPKWGDIRLNYGEVERSEVDELMSPDFVPGQGGQLLLWRGLPGTGKTTALRALGHAWRSWAHIHYITDPEQFFGEHADYMLQVMLGAGDVAGPDKDGKWRILVLEDAGELLQKDSKQKIGQALSRFLNAVDGMIGQGLRFLTLVTTNEQDLGALNDAVSRHGRAAANIEFKALAPEEAVGVLCSLREDFTPPQAEELVAGRNMVLADIYALAEGREGQKAEPIGFAAAA